jgi:hypothetical protein
MTRKTVSMLIVTAIVAAVVGGYVGGRFSGEAVAVTFMNLRQQVLASDIKLRVKLLEQLRAGENDKALKMSDALLVGDLISLGGYIENEGARIDSNTMESLLLAKRYREKFPLIMESHEVNAELDKLFRNVK